MAQLTTMARPYARAAFEVALAEGDLQGWSDMLRKVAAVASSERVMARLNAPSVGGEQKARLLTDLLGDEINAKTQNFVHLLAENKRLGLLPDVVVLFEELKADQEKRVEVDVVSAYALSDSVQKTLTESLKKRLQREVNLNTRVDQSLIGGLVIHAGDMVIDGSVRGRLNKLAETIKA